MSFKLCAASLLATLAAALPSGAAASWSEEWSDFTGFFEGLWGRPLLISEVSGLPSLYVSDVAVIAGIIILVCILAFLLRRGNR